MSAEPAHTGPGGTPATVILFRKRTKPARRTHGQDAAPPSELPAATPHHRFAHRIEQKFLKNDRTLTDPETAEAYQVAVGVFDELLEGARIAGLIDDRAHGELHAMIDGMRAAPNLVENV